MMDFALERDYAQPRLRTPCPKCSGKGVQINYCVSAHAGQAKVDLALPEPEHLDLTCQWCGYVRFMLTRDYRVQPVQERNVSG